MEIYNISSDYVMARPECTDLRARYYLLSGDHSPLWGRGHYKLESFGFWRRKFCIRNVEILTLGKIAEFAKFAGEKDESLQTAFVLYILAKGEDIVDGKRIGVLMECSGAERRQNDNLLIPCAH